MIGLGLPGRHSTGLNRIWLVDTKGLSQVTVCPPMPISNFKKNPPIPYIFYVSFLDFHCGIRIHTWQESNFKKQEGTCGWLQSAAFIFIKNVTMLASTQQQTNYMPEMDSPPAIDSGNTETSVDFCDISYVHNHMDTGMAYRCVNSVRQTVCSNFNQSVNQTSIAPISLAKPGSVARQPNQCSTAKIW